VHATTRLPFGLFFAPAIWLGWLLQATVLQIY
jgi:leader peptidase (prepilin peptidase)/N-methyltransferase